MKTIITLTLLSLYIISTASYAQSAPESKSSTSLKTELQQKRPLSPKDYKLWSTLNQGKEISNNGDWYAYTLSYNRYQIDTLFVIATRADRKYHFPSGKSGQFSEKSTWFGCLAGKKGLALLNLEKGTTQWVLNVSKFEFLTVNTHDKYLIALRNPMDSTAQSNLLIMDLTNGTQETIPGVTEYKRHQASNNLVYIIDTEGKKKVVHHSLETVSKTKRITENKTHRYKKLNWSKDGSTLAFLQEAPKGAEEQKRHKLYYYNTKQGPSKLKCLDPTTNTSLFQDMDITDYSLRMSDDGMAVFFDVLSKENLEIQSKSALPVDVQVWNTKDKRIYSKRIRDQRSGFAEFGVWRCAWWPMADKTMQLETKALPEAIVSRNSKYMLSYNPTAHAPNLKKYKGDIDLYLTNLETGKHHLFLKQQEYNSNSFSYNVEFSPGGKYIYYFKNKHWWVYDLEKKTHTSVTKGLGLQLYKTADEAPRPGIAIYGVPGWTLDDKALIIHDQYDVWLVAPQGKAQRLTQGKKKQVRHRVVYRNRAREFNTAEGLIIKTFGTRDKASGYAIWKPKRGLKTMVYKTMRITELKKAKEKEAYIYLEQSFDIAPRIRYWEKGMPDSRILVVTNPQQKQFQWGSKAELIHYTGPEGQTLQGALFYPADYKTGKKYPMIVYVYEQVSNALHAYSNPTEYLQSGFNRTNYTLDGYLVFLPDIIYKFNDPGVSALQCVEAGVKAVQAKGVVEEDHIGLVGHSFGGYETSFIITQSNLFAAAVAGATLTDLVSWYHTVSFGGFEMNNFHWFEHGQHRMPDSFYQNPKAYLRNSPLHHADHIKTPLLLWTGEKDPVIDWHQSIELYSGLRRLGKTCTLLVYPEEGHSIYKKPENMLDLTRRMKVWLASYLKPNAEKGKTFK